ncbi:MAG: hypothetical protein RBR81_06550 [Bacteroidales bacterium]|nr:hypothetical protein [Bacteroidales bacterium]
MAKKNNYQHNTFILLFCYSAIVPGFWFKVPSSRNLEPETRN